jgi:hypothetical protein
MNTRSVTSVTYILIGYMFFIYYDIGEGWTVYLTTLFGVILYLLGLFRLKEALDETGKSAINKLFVAFILGFVAYPLKMLPLLGSVLVFILNLSALVLQLKGYNKLKKSSSLNSKGVAGAGLLIVATILVFIAGIVGILPFAGSYIKPIIAFIAFIIVPFGWLKIQAGLIECGKDVIIPSPIEETKKPSFHTPAPKTILTDPVQQHKPHGTISTVSSNEPPRRYLKI